MNSTLTIILLEVRFDEPEHSWIGLSVFASGEQIIFRAGSYIYPSLSQLVTALKTMLDARQERSVMWMEEPTYLEMRFSQ